jgi:exopolysaccharide production protein ExoQ
VFLLKLVEKIFVIFSLIFFTGAIGVLMNGGTAPSALQSDLVSRLSSYVIQVGTFCLIVIWYKSIIRTVIKEKFLWVLLAIALVSVLWSEQTWATLGSNQNFIRITLFGVYFASRYSLKEQLRLLAWALGIGATLSLAFALAIPSYGVMGMGNTITKEIVTHAGAWQGIYGHKNILGRIMVLSTVVFAILAISSRRYSWLAWISFGLSLILILGSTSKTTLLIFLTIMALLPFYRALRWNNTIAVPFFIALVLIGGSVGVLLIDNGETILEAFGRDLTLTGRTDLWAAALDKIWERPWLGYGYGAFWRGWSSESADVWNVVRWQAPHSHNGFLDLWLDLGLLGLSAFALSFLGTCWRAVQWVRQTKTAEGLWPLAYLTFLLLANMTESSLLRQNSLWILYVAVTLSMHNINGNLAEYKVGSSQKVKSRKMKQITPKVWREKI